jgi:hypothetical protein
MDDRVHDENKLSMRYRLITTPNTESTVDNTIKQHYYDRNVFLSLLLTDHWLYEICSLAMGIICFVCVIALLKIYDGKERPQWTDNITLNTVLSWLSTFWQASLVMPVAAGISQLCWVWCAEKTKPLRDVCYYDAASRGPWGSLLLLYRLKEM